ELTAGDVDRQPQVPPVEQPRRQLPARLVQQPRSDLVSQLQLFGERHELIRQHRTQTGVAPAQQRLRTNRAVVVQIHHQLVRQVQLAAIKNPGKFLLQA